MTRLRLASIVESRQELRRLAPESPSQEGEGELGNHLCHIARKDELAELRPTVTKSRFICEGHKAEFSGTWSKCANKFLVSGESPRLKFFRGLPSLMVAPRRPINEN